MDELGWGGGGPRAAQGCGGKERKGKGWWRWVPIRWDGLRGHPPPHPFPSGKLAIFFSKVATMEIELSRISHKSVVTLLTWHNNNNTRSVSSVSFAMAGDEEVEVEVEVEVEIPVKDESTGQVDFCPLTSAIFR